ncbi:DNA repair protein complementing XP-C cells-like [Dysidea avara]|uniref:DNA repair protein complementing XP-C cells-like n=1 Tax=Dysidea avara TaxID=196820 RepID=UPI00331B37E7
MSSSSDSDVEWEEVDRVFSPATSAPDSTAQTPTSLEITVNVDGSVKKKSTKSFLERALEKFNKELKENLHKCNLLCLLSHGLKLNRQCNQQLVQAQLLSLLPTDLVADDFDKHDIMKILNWFTLKHDAVLELSVGLGMSSVQLSVSLFRSLGISTRLILSLDPLPFKEKKASAKNPKKTTASNNISEPSRTPTNKDSRKRSSSKRKLTSESKQVKSPYFTDNKQKGKVKKEDDSGSTSENDFEYKPPQTRSGVLGKRLRSATKNKPFKQPRSKAVNDDPPQLVSSNTEMTPRAKIPVTPTEFYEGRSGYTAHNSWIEVKLSGSWETVYLSSQSVGNIGIIEEATDHPLVYVIGIDENGSVKDISPKYAFKWCTVTRKQRIPGSWWSDTLQPYLTDVDSDKEDLDIKNLLLERPMPNTISDFKDHPLYALKRHLLKFEAIYPEESQVLGYCNLEPIYARECVHTLHTRETWLKQARVVKKGEEAYKSVKARPKRGQRADEERRVDVFGYWQTEVYTPPPVVDGKIQRNEYGNIELFQPSMLPKGACHIQLPGIYKIAKLLDIDCVPAMMGWDFSSGHCHPVIDGIVTAEENKPILLAAWDERQDDSRKKQQERKQKKIYERWRLLIRGVLLKERVQKHFQAKNI